VTEVDVVAQQKDEQQLADIFLLLVAVERLVAFELTSNVRELLVHALDFRLFALACIASDAR
jgi:hypothetical protein